MRRLRVFRLLLLALLIPFVIILAIQLGKDDVVSDAFPDRPEPDSAQGIEFKEIDGGKLLVSGVAQVVQRLAGGEFRAERIDDTIYVRRDGNEFGLRADEMVIAGKEGARRLRLDGGVRLSDFTTGLELELPRLRIDQGKEEARSEGAVAFSGPAFRGRAEALLYPLDDRPAELSEIHIDRDDGSSLSARQALLIDGIRDVEFVGAFRADGPEGRVEADRCRVRRTEEDLFESMVMTGGVAGLWRREGGPDTEFVGERMELGYDDGGEVDRLLLAGQAEVRQSVQRLAAETIEADRVVAEGPWVMRARTAVEVTMKDRQGTSRLTAVELDLTADALGQLDHGEVRGDVRFSAPARQTTAEADRATVDFDAEAERIVLYASADRRARLRRGRSRVAAERIATDAAGDQLLASTRVEATLMPEDGGEEASETGLFRTDEAVHFVARRLEGDPSRNELTFTGAVRGWQGERTVSGDRIVLREERDEMIAEGDVETRIPRRADQAARQADFAQITSQRLHYLGKAPRALFEETVKVRIAEGFVESDRLEVELLEEGGIRKALARGQVRFEFVSTDEDGQTRRSTGSGDRMLYEPHEERVTLFGDTRPASVRQGGKNPHTTRGRVLRYDLDTGEVEVESGIIEVDQS